MKLFITLMYLMVGVSSTVSLAAPASPPVVNLPNRPLYGGNANVPPNMLLSLSIEYPVVGIAYKGDSGTYNKNTDYIGYFNNNQCYQYVGGNRNINNGYFAISVAADSLHECDGTTFSGNFMNWVSNSQLDLLRYVLTGGDRIIDTADTSIVQRATLPDSFYAAYYFPLRTLTASATASAPNKVTPFKIQSLNIVSCKNKILFGYQQNLSSGQVAVTSPNCDTLASDTVRLNFFSSTTYIDLDKNLGEYLTRVKVCDDNEGPNRAGLCQKYGDHYKPVGVIQRNADRMRFGLMSYTNDGSTTRYGGVLRAPLKHVGPKTYDQPDYKEKPNLNSEWDPATGVLYNNPVDPANRNSSTVNSGAVNYINKFGRSGQYKTKDPISELYYEGLRYLQGLPPTPDALAGVGSSDDGFPVIKTWEDPITASCQANSIIVIGDVNTQDDFYIPGNKISTITVKVNNVEVKHSETPRNIESGIPNKIPPLDALSWTREVGKRESDPSGFFGNSAPNLRLGSLNDVQIPNKFGSYYLAGLAYWANTNDIRLVDPTKLSDDPNNKYKYSKIRVSTYAIDLDERGDGTIEGGEREVKPRDSQLYLAAKYGGFIDRNKDNNPFVTGSPDRLNDVRSNVEWDSDNNGIPDNYFLASQASAIDASLKKIFNRGTQLSGSIGGAATSGATISANGAFLYQAGFESASWSGSLKKISLGKFNNTADALSASSIKWDAAAVLTGSAQKTACISPANRAIFTAKGLDNGILQTIAFKNLGDLSAAQQLALNTSPSTLQKDNNGQARIDYLRGDRSKEIGQVGGIFRTRLSLLGDIVNSNPFFLGEPTKKSAGQAYQTFYDEKKGRQKVVYVGANDGMLHAFHAFGESEGCELFAYIPSVLIDKLSKLTDPDYVHQPFVDGGIVVDDVQVGSAWKTVLASGMGGGAQGVFAIDVSSQNSFQAGQGAILEFTDRDDPDMGNIYPAPIFAKFKTGKDANGKVMTETFLVVQSGLNNYQKDGNANPNAPQSIFLLKLNNPAVKRWALGVNYYKFTLPASDLALANGLGPISIVSGSDGVAQFGYVGDLQGKLWRLNFSDLVLGSASSTLKTKVLFSAKDNNGLIQPITTQPRVVFAQGGGYLVLFGTGQYLENNDTLPANFKTQTFYAIYDQPKDTSSDNVTTDVVTGRAQLAPRSAVLNSDKTAVIVSGSDAIIGPNKNDKRGWYMDFAESISLGERNVSNAVIADGLVYFNSLSPGADPCGNGGGRAYTLNVLTGLPPGGLSGLISTVGLFGPPTLYYVNDTAQGVSTSTGLRSAKKQAGVFSIGSGGAGGTLQVTGSSGQSILAPAGRFSWREIFNWQKLRATILKN